jgi:hypothetical protein
MCIYMLSPISGMKSVVTETLHELRPFITEKSTPGEGSRFWFILPSYTEDAAALPHTSETAVPETTLLHRLAQLEKTTLHQLTQTAQDGDLTALQALIAQVTQVDAIAGRALNEIVNRFDYERIVTLTRAAQTHPLSGTLDRSSTG